MIKKLVKHIIGRNGYSFLLNTKLGQKMHDNIHVDSPTSRDFILQLFPKHSIGVEIGVNDGDFSERIIEIVRPKKLHLIDPWKFEEGEIYQDAPYGSGKIQNQNKMDEKFQAVIKRFEVEIQKNQVVIGRGFSDQILLTFEDEYFDWAYIDGNHLYDFVKKDLEICFKKVKKGGFITGDDYYDGGWSAGGVKKAVDEFVDSKIVKIIQIKNNQFILQK